MSVLSLPYLGIAIIKAMHRRREKKTALIPLRCLMLLLVVPLGAVGIRLLPATAGQGWIPGMALIGALGLITGALANSSR